MERVVLPGAVVVRLEERPCLTPGDHERVAQALMQAGRQGTRLVIDCSRLTWVNGSFLGALASIRKQLGARLGDIVLAAVPEMIRPVFEVTHLDRLFPIHATCDDAIRADWPEPPPTVVDAAK